MRQDGTIVWTRALRPRHFPTQYGHAALHRAIGVTCVYQSDSSSKRPVAFVVFDTTSYRPQFSTCWRKRAATNNAPRPAAAYSEGPHPAAPRSVRQHVENCAPHRPQQALGRSPASGEIINAHKCRRIDDR